MKSYTDLEQSKKLAEILPPESADHFHIIGHLHTDGPRYEVIRSKNEVSDHDSYWPCWSLAALISIIPNYKLNSEHNYHTCTAVTSFGKETVGWYDNPVDACVAIIEKLHELNLL